MSMVKAMNLRELVAGDRVRLRDFGCTPIGYRRRLMACGLTPGVEVEIIRYAPLGCPVQINVRGVSIALRISDAKSICWERI